MKGLMRIRSVVLTVVCLAAPVWAELVPPTPITPANGSLLQLPAGTTTLLLQWTEVADATGYLLEIRGPEAFEDLIGIPVDPTPGTVSFTVNNIVPGDYVWSVAAVAGQSVVSSSPYFFTIQSPPPTGGNLPAPDLLQPRDFAFFLGTSGSITFQWTRVSGAESYQLELASLDGSISFFPVTTQTIDGTTVRQTYQIASGNKARIYSWHVSAVDESGVGDSSPDRTFAFLPKNLSRRDFPLPFASVWHKVNSFLDVNGDASTNLSDLFPFLEFWHDSGPTTVDSPGPTPLIPSNEAIVSQNDILFAWNTVPGARSYELVIRSSSQGVVTTHLLPQTSSGTISTRLAFLAAGDYEWQVRALFGGGDNATRYSESQVFIVAIQSPTPKRSFRLSGRFGK